VNARLFEPWHKNVQKWSRLDNRLFEMEKLKEVAKPASEPKIDRPYSLPGILLGTSAFTANGWEGSFYPPGMKSRDFLSYYATQFATVEVDSTFYGCPSASTVNNNRRATALGRLTCGVCANICVAFLQI